MTTRVLLLVVSHFLLLWLGSCYSTRNCTLCQSGRTVRRDSCAVGGLGLAVLVGGPDGELVGARGGLVPCPGPLAPGVDAVLVGQVDVLPGLVVDPDLDALDAGVLRPRDAADADLVARERLERLRDVDARGELDRRLGRVAAGRPVRLEVGEPGDLDVDQPLGGRDVAVQAGDDHADGEAVLERQRLAVHADGDEGVAVLVGERAERRADGHVVGARGLDGVGARLDAGAREQVAHRDAEPGGVADVGPADLVRHAGQGDAAARRGAP